QASVLDISELEKVPRPIVARGSLYPANHIIPPHRHARAQLLCALSGMAIVTAERNRWLILPEHALWIPAGVRHSLEVIEPLSIGSVYIAADTPFGRSAEAHLVRMSELMRSLIPEAVKLPPEYDPESRGGLIMALIIQ